MSEVTYTTSPFLEVVMPKKNAKTKKNPGDKKQKAKKGKR